MSSIVDFPVTKKWPPANPQLLQLYSQPTPNGVKVSAMLEEIGLPYEAHSVGFGARDQFSDEFLAINPNNKIPVILDPEGPDGKPLALWESGAILVYLADKSGRLMPSAPGAHFETLQWVMWQMAGVGPMFGQLGYFFKFAGREIEDKRPLERYVAETQRLLRVLDQRLVGRDWIMDDLSIADFAVFPWVRTVRDFYGAGELVGLNKFENVTRVLAAFLARPSVQRSLSIPPRVS